MFVARSDGAVFHCDPTGKRSGLRLFIQNKLLLDPGRHHRIPQIDLILHRIDQLGAINAWFTDLLQLRNHGDADIVFFQNGYYLSPDLVPPRFSLVNVTLLAAGGGMAVLGVFPWGRVRAFFRGLNASRKTGKPGREGEP